jgi:LuxR family transcriptional regulator, maltose regulon positive regulatory protein
MSHPSSRMDLLYTKLHPPPVREKQVVRMHLLEKLDGALNQRLTLVCAPAGYGKTTLLSQWIIRRAEPVGWVSLDRSDNDLTQFLRYFLAALQRVEPNISAQTPEMLQAPQPLTGLAVWMPLINEIAASAKEFVVVLDDYHEVEDRAVHEALDYLIEHVPDNLHLIIATRADPPLSLPRLRARGYLTELRLSDLRFSAEETANFLNNIMNLGLSVRDIATLESRTEGWITSLQMAALSLQMHSPDLADRSVYIQTFKGSHRFILDYLVEEVLEHQPPSLQAFLLKTSILERLSGSLCDAVIGDDAGKSGEAMGANRAAGAPMTSSQSILEHLESANLFIVPLDDERIWFRYHRLFSDLLRKRLWQKSPGLIPLLHDRASFWYMQEGFAGEAIHHALAAKSYERAAMLIEDNVEATLMRSEVRTFLTWMEKLPDEYGRNRLKLSFFHAWALLMSGQSLEVVERRLQSIANVQGADESTGTMAGRMAALRAYLLLFQGDIILAAKLCNQALENLPESDLFLRSVVTWILSMIRLTGREQQDGRQALDKVIRMSQEAGNPLIAVAALSHQARLQMRQGCLQVAHETLGQALQLATDAQGRRLPIASEALIGLGELEREWNNLEKAEEYLTESIELANQWNELSSFDAYYPLMRLRLAQGDVAAAREAIETAWKLAHDSDFSQIDDILADLQRASFFGMQGNAAEVMRWAEKHGLISGVALENRPAPDERQDYINSHLHKYENLVLVRAFILQGRTVEAFELLETLLAQAKQLERTDLAIEIHILRALTFQHAGDGDRALEALAEALSLAESGGYIRIFLDEGEPMARLLRQAASRGLAPVYVAKLLQASGEPATLKREVRPSYAHSLIEPLSDRELEVLRLLASGLSNPEIASQLYIAVSTVRTHCKNIYGKLGVRRRWDAVQRAQELGLI